MPSQDDTGSLLSQCGLTRPALDIPHHRPEHPRPAKKREFRDENCWSGMQNSGIWDPPPGTTPKELTERPGATALTERNESLSVSTR